MIVFADDDRAVADHAVELLFLRIGVNLQRVVLQEARGSASARADERIFGGIHGFTSLGCLVNFSRS